MTSYPRKPGFKEATVSKANAAFGQARFARMQKRVLELYRNGFVGTADDAAEKLGMSPFSARPRCTELVRLGFLARLRVDRSKPGRSAWVLCLAPEPAPSSAPAPPGDGVPVERDLFDDGQPDELKEWNDYDPDC